MTTIKQNKHARPAAVELRDDALDRAVGGGSIGGIFVAGVDVNNDGSVRTITGGTTKPRT